MALHERSDDELKEKLSSGELGDKKTAIAEAVLRHRRTERMQAWLNRHAWLAGSWTWADRIKGSHGQSNWRWSLRAMAKPDTPGLTVSHLQDDPNAPIKQAEFLALAWTAANDKARELGWIVWMSSQPWKPLAIILAVLLVGALIVTAVVAAGVANLGFSLF
jgi:hypothetical protein